jgi:hypothetical protein
VKRNFVNEMNAMPLLCFIAGNTFLLILIFSGMDVACVFEISRHDFITLKKNTICRSQQSSTQGTMFFSNNSSTLKKVVTCTTDPIALYAKNQVLFIITL